MEDDNLYELSPPWLQESINFYENDDAENEKESSKQEVKITERSDETVTDKESPKQEQNNEKLSASLCSEANVNDTSDMRNAKDFLHNLTEILKCDGNVVDRSSNQTPTDSFLMMSLFIVFAMAMYFLRPRTLRNYSDADAKPFGGGAVSKYKMCK